MPQPRPPVKKTPPRRRGWRWLFFLALWLLLGGAFGGFSIYQAYQYRVLRAQLAAIEADIAREHATHDALLRELDFIGSDAYIEQAARQRLGMVGPNEIIFRNRGW